MSEFSWRTRAAALDLLSRVNFDLLIIGGGITGAGLALDAATRGLRVALIEKRDFGAGTSSRSTKLIHGGLRYLEHFDFALVREGLRERALLVRLAPHLVTPFPFLIPIYRSRPRNYDHPLKVRAGLILYDLLAGRAGFGRHRRINAAEARRVAPQLDPTGLRGAYVYHDAQTDDARLVIEIIKTAAARGATVTNYTRLVGLRQDQAGRLTGARVRDERSGVECDVRARLIINATGVWLDDVRDLGGAEPAGGRRVRPSKGVHLLLPAARLQVSAAWLIPSLVAHRFYFVVPWEGRVLVGTTDTDYAGDRDAPRAEAAEVREILGAINSYFPAAQLSPEDVIATFAGLRPLVSDGERATTDVSREDELFERGDGLISIAGGKLTTYRQMAERTIDFALARLASNGFPRSRTASEPIGGGALSRDDLAALASRLAREENLEEEVTAHLAHAYGADLARIVEIAREDQALRARLVAGLPHLSAEIVYAARHEMALTLADALARRTRLALLAGSAAIEAAPAAAALMAREIGWDEDETARQIDAFNAEYAREYAAPAL